MIENERQYQFTQKRIQEFEASLKSLRATPRPENVPEKIHRAMIESVESQLEALRVEVAEYEALKSQRVRELELKSLDDLPDLFIKARLARGYTQAELAKKLKVKPQQVQRYEATRYQSISFKRLLDVAGALDLDLHKMVKL